MPDLFQQNYVKQRAFDAAGRTVYFAEQEGGGKKMGKVVGYYPAMGQIVIECYSEPMYPVDPLSSYLKPVFQLTMYAKCWYVCVELGLIEWKVAKDPRYPHACPRCGSAALVLFRTVECSNYSCAHKRQS